MPTPHAGSGSSPPRLVRTCPKCQAKFPTSRRGCPQCGADYRDAMDARQGELEEATQFRFESDAEAAAALFKAGGRSGVLLGGILLLAAGLALFVLLWREHQLDVLNVLTVLVFVATGVVVLVRTLRPPRHATGRGEGRRAPTRRRRP
jgi:hypothetical protein